MGPGDAPSPTGMLDRESVLSEYRAHVNRGLAKLAELMGVPVEDRSAGSLVFDDAAQAYLDCGGYGVFILGHCHPAVIDAVTAQLRRHPLATRVLLNRELALAATTLASVTPRGLDYVFFTNSGAEAVETGIKLARLNGARRIIAMEGGFHGKTIGALSVTGRHHYREPFEPLLPAVEFVPFNDLDALAGALAGDEGGSAVILEPVQAEGGVIIPSDGYLGEVRALCDRRHAFLILDEIQTGLGRLGAWWGADRAGVVPDVMLVGKGLSGGAVPVGAVAASATAFEPFNRDPLLHTSTFGGNPLAMAAVHAAIRAMENERIVERASTLGQRILEGVRYSLADLQPGLVREVRGVGLLVGIEFGTDYLAGDFMLELLRRKVVVSHSLNAHRVVRLTPPAVLSNADCDWLFGAVQEAGIALHRRYAG